MSNTKIRGSAAIVGVGLSGCGEAPGRTAMEIQAEAAYRALADAGLRTTDVDGLISVSAYTTAPTLMVGEYLGIRPKFSDTNRLGGASFVSHLLPAALALQAGLCNVVLICYGSNQRTAYGKLKSMTELGPYEAPYKPRFPIAAFALAAARHMYEYGTTREQLAEVAVSARKWAQLNPEAFMREPLSIQQALAARMVCDPLTAAVQSSWYAAIAHPISPKSRSTCWALQARIRISRFRRCLILRSRPLPIPDCARLRWLDCVRKMSM
jgi:acetyl-CoA acetyltransferase